MTTKVLQFLKKHKNSGVWLDASGIKIVSDSYDGRSENIMISPLMFTYLNSMNLLNSNSYSGFKAIRIFHKNKKNVSKAKIKTFNSGYINLSKKNKKYVKSQLLFLKTLINENLITAKYETTKDNLKKIKKDLNFYRDNWNWYIDSSFGQISLGYMGHRWTKKRTIQEVKNKINEIESLDNVDGGSNIKISVFDYKRSPLPNNIENLLKSINI